jgi:hypothetical protein
MFQIFLCIPRNRKNNELKYIFKCFDDESFYLFMITHFIIKHISNYGKYVIYLLCFCTLKLNKRINK